MILSHFFMISTALLTSYFISRKCFILEIYIKKSKIKVYLQEKKGDRKIVCVRMNDSLN